MNHPVRSSFFGAAAALAAFVSPTVSPQACAAAAKPDEEIITMSEFSVNAQDDRGYVASETMTGTRVAIKILDLPYTVNVLNSEYFEEFGLFELSDNITQVGSFTSLDIGGGFNLRGFGSSSQLRDGFYRLGRYGSSNIDRMEIIKGSNAAIYGRTSPGGMVNMISKQPKSRRYNRIMLTAGEYGMLRGALEATGSLYNGPRGQTSYVFTASQMRREFDQDWALNKNQEYYLALKHTFADRSSLLVSAEYFLQKRRAPTVAAPIVIDQKGTSTANDDVAVGYAKTLAGYNPYGPNSELNRGNVGFTSTYEKRFTDVWSARVAGNYFRARRWDFNQNTGFGSININPPTAGAAVTTTRGTTPNRGLIMEDGGGIQADLLAHYWLANRSVENRTLFTIDFNDYYRWDPTWNYSGTTNPDIVAWTASSSGRVVALDPLTLSPLAPLSYFPKEFQKGQEVLNRLTRRRTTVLGGLLRHQSALMNGRLLAYAGTRFDAVRFQERDWTTAASSFTKYAGYENYVPGDMIRRTVTQTKPNLGLNYRIPGNLRVYANYSQSYFVNQTDNPVVFADPDYKPEIADGYDYGIKGALLDDRLNFTVSGYYATRKNVSVSNTFENPVGSGLYVTDNQRDGDQLVRGFEIDLSWQIRDDVSFMGSWGYVYSVYTDYGSASPLSIGRRVNGVSPQNGGLSLRYGPRRGVLQGFSANLGWTYVAATPTENPNAGDTYSTTAAGARVLTRSTYTWALRIPAYDLWNLGVRYALKTRSGSDHTFAVNINNLADKDYLRANKQLGDRRAVYFTYMIGLPGFRF